MEDTKLTLCLNILFVIPHTFFNPPNKMVPNLPYRTMGQFGPNNPNSQEY